MEADQSEDGYKEAPWSNPGPDTAAMAACSSDQPPGTPAPAGRPGGRYGRDQLQAMERRLGVGLTMDCFGKQGLPPQLPRLPRQTRSSSDGSGDLFEDAEEHSWSNEDVSGTQSDPVHRFDLERTEAPLSAPTLGGNTSSGGGWARRGTMGARDHRVGATRSEFGRPSWSVLSPIIEQSGSRCSRRTDAWRSTPPTALSNASQASGLGLRLISEHSSSESQSVSAPNSFKAPSGDLRPVMSEAEASVDSDRGVPPQLQAEASVESDRGSLRESDEVVEINVMGANDAVFQSFFDKFSS